VELVRIVSFGEGMIEERADGSFGWGGDAVNVAVYLARQGAAPALMSGMGVDGESEAVTAAWAGEGIDVTRVLRDPGRRAGSYRIAVGEGGERRFAYDRAASAARAFFSRPEAEAVLAWAASADILILSGITLSIYTASERAWIVELAASVRRRGGKVAFDPNYRPAGWPSREAAWAAVEAIAPYISLALPSLEDHLGLKGDAEPEAVTAAWLGLGAEEAVVTLGASGAFAARAGQTAFAEAASVEALVDTTGAGDAFDAAYIAARLVHAEPMAAALAHATALAAETTAWPGAIAPAHVGRRRLG